MSYGKVGRRAVVVVLALAGAPASRAQVAAPAGNPAPVRLIGVDARVVLKNREATLKIEKKVVATGEVHRVYRVERVRDDWLWVSDDDVSGWVRSGDVIPLDQAVAHFSEEIKKRPKSAYAYLMRAMIWYDRQDYDRAIADDGEAIKLEPRNALAYSNRGDARLAKREYARAVADYDEATKLDPKDASSYANRAVARVALNDFDLAIADDNEAIRLDPSDVAKYHHRALVWAATREYERALSDYNEAVKIDPNDAAACNGRAWIWATAPDPKARDGRKAVASASRACEITRWQDPYCLGTLAAADAEAGHFEAAVKWQIKAIELFAKDHPDAAGHQRRLTLYQAKKPYRDEAPRR